MTKNEVSLILNQFKNLKDDIRDLKEDLEKVNDKLDAYKGVTNERITKIRITVGKLLVYGAFSGLIGGFSAEKVKKTVPFYKEEKIISVKKENENGK